MLEPPSGPLLLMNGDILTDLDLGALMQAHQERQAALTVAVQTFTYTIPYGVLRSRGNTITGIVEKPQRQYTVSAGIYVLAPSLCALVPPGPSDMPDLIARVAQSGQRVVSYPFTGYWQDIGTVRDYRQARTVLLQRAVTHANGTYGHYSTV